VESLADNRKFIAVDGCAHGSECGVHVLYEVGRCDRLARQAMELGQGVPKAVTVLIYTEHLRRPVDGEVCQLGGNRALIEGSHDGLQTDIGDGSVILPGEAHSQDVAASGVDDDRLFVRKIFPGPIVAKGRQDGRPGRARAAGKCLALNTEFPGPHGDLAFTDHLNEVGVDPLWLELTVMRAEGEEANLIWRTTEEAGATLPTVFRKALVRALA